MRIFKTRGFSRFARKAGLGDPSLTESIARAGRGLLDADLGGGVIKQRIGRPSEGRSGGFRTIILFKLEVRAVFVYGFAKNERQNIGDDELRAFRDLAVVMLAYDEGEIATALENGALIEVRDEQRI